MLTLSDYETALAHFSEYPNVTPTETDFACAAEVENENGGSYTPTTVAALWLWIEEFNLALLNMLRLKIQQLSGG